MSDGSDAPIELLEKAEQAGCLIFSVTDHDDLRSNLIILKMIGAGQYAARFITGAEISSVFGERNLHLLCYGFDTGAKSIRELIAEGNRLRRVRVAALIDHLRSRHGIIIPDADKTEIMTLTTPGKMHIADAALKTGIKMTRAEFFSKYLDDMESREFKIPAERVIDAAAAAGGVVSFAHPIEMQKEYGVGFSEIYNIAKKLKDRGLSAIEVYNSSHGEREVTEYAQIADKAGLLISGGSDYHGAKKPGINIGRLAAQSDALCYERITILSKIKRRIYP